MCVWIIFVLFINAIQFYKSDKFRINCNTFRSFLCLIVVVAAWICKQKKTFVSVHCIQRTIRLSRLARHAATVAVVRSISTGIIAGTDSVTDGNLQKVLMSMSRSGEVEVVDIRCETCDGIESMYRRVRADNTKKNRQNRSIFICFIESKNVIFTILTNW